MPITDTELRDNYYLSVVVYLCDYASPYSATDSSTGEPWACTLADNGNEPHPNPYISSWDIKSHEQPSDEKLMATVSMSMIDAARAELYPPSEMRVLRDLVSKLTAEVATLKSALRQPLPADARRDSLEDGEFDLLADQEIPPPKYK